jgi:hypothetical protein
MTSHLQRNGYALTIGMNGNVKFKKKPNSFNRCVADELSGGSYANRQAVKSAFTRAAKDCSHKKLGKAV